MRKFAALLIGLLAPLLSSANAVNVFVVRNQVNSAWTLACTIKAYDCSKVRPPDVIFDIYELGLWGRYQIGSHQVHITPRLLEDPFSIVVMAHEMVHYLQWLNGELTVPKTPEMNCRAEKEAFDIDVAVAELLGMLQDGRLAQWADVAAAYGCDTAGAPVLALNGPPASPPAV